MTDENKKLVQEAIRNTWNVLAYDCIQANEGEPMPKDHVVEVVLDASYLEMYARQNQKQAVAEFRKLEYKIQDKIAGEALGNFKRFGI